MKCHGNAKDHCCYLGQPCLYVEEGTVPGRRWACGLYRQVGSWEKVYQMPEYPSVRAKLRTLGVVQDCGEWPPVGVRCESCGGIDNG